MREFWLEDDLGEKYSFSNNLKCLASNPSNFGLQNENTYFEYQNSFVTATTSIPMRKPTLDLMFIEGYKSYQEFLQFISNAKELRLFYKAYDTKYCLVDIYQLTKGDLTAATSLKSQIVFNQKSMWMKEFKVSITTEANGSYKAYDYSYSYEYAEVVNNQIEATNNGSTDAPVNYTIIGSLNNPEVIVEQNGQVICKSKFNLTYDNATLEVISEEGKELMQVTTSDGRLVNVYQQQDFTSDGFLFLPKGRSIIKINPGAVGQSHIYNVTFHEMYQGN